MDPVTRGDGARTGEIELSEHGLVHKACVIAIEMWCEEGIGVGIVARVLSTHNAPARRVRSPPSTPLPVVSIVSARLRITVRVLPIIRITVFVVVVADVEGVSEEEEGVIGVCNE